MKNRFHVSMLALLAGLLIMPAQAQSEKRLNDNYPYGFMSIAGGGLWTPNSSLPQGRNRFTPMGEVGIGGMVCPYFGLRFTMDAGAEKLLVDGEKTKETYLYSNLDAMVDVTNFFYGTKPHLLHLYAVGGVGLGTLPNESRTDKMPYNVRVGGQLEARINEHWGVYVEGLAVNRHNIVDAPKHWQAQTMLGIKYCFTGKQNYKMGLNAASAAQEYYNAQNAMNANAAETAARQKVVAKDVKPATAEPKTPAAKVEQVVCQPVNIFFDLGKTQVVEADPQLRNIANYVKQHPNTKVYVTGYADAGTGSHEVNLRVSQRRAEAVAKALQQHYGIKADAMKVNYKGDTEQPFANNDDNRVVIVVAQ